TGAATGRSRPGRRTFARLGIAARRRRSPGGLVTREPAVRRGGDVGPACYHRFVADPVLAARSATEGALREVFGHDGFRTGQRAAIDGVMASRDALVLLPTGAGKSLCYQVPAVALARSGRGTTLVVSPLIALMDDQVGAL